MLQQTHVTQQKNRKTKQRIAETTLTEKKTICEQTKQNKNSNKNKQKQKND